MEERIPLVDANDTIIGTATKREGFRSFKGIRSFIPPTAHLYDSVQHRSYLHRAFSVLLFDPAGKLLLQQRSKSKLTFPLLWANTCCSHPLATIKEEVSDDSALGFLLIH